jgi:hypothetical protein
MGYESFLMDIEMYGNPFNHDYNRFSLLGTDRTWFRNLWELVNDFNVTATLGDEFHLRPV